MKVTVAAMQMSCTWDKEENLAKAERIVREAAAAGAQVVLPQVLMSQVLPQVLLPMVVELQVVFPQLLHA